MTEDQSLANPEHPDADATADSNRSTHEPGLLETIGPWVAFLLTLASPLYPFGLYILQRELENQHHLGSNTAWYIAAQVPTSVTVTQAVEALLSPSVPYIMISVIVGTVSDPIINTALPWLMRRSAREAHRPSSRSRWTPLTISVIVAFVSTARYMLGEHVVLPIALVSTMLAGIAALTITIGVHDALFPTGRFFTSSSGGSSLLRYSLASLLFVYLSVLAPVVFAVAPNDLPLVTIVTKMPFDGSRVFTGELITHADGRWYMLDCLTGRVPGATDLIPESVVGSISIWPKHPHLHDLHPDLHHTRSQLSPDCLSP